MRMMKRAAPTEPPVKPRLPRQSDLTRVVSRTQGRINKLVDRLESGKIDADGFGNGMAALLEDRHARAAVLGRKRAGDTAPLDADDRRYAQVVMDGESEYLDKFVQKLKSGEPIDSAAVRRRAGSYASRLIGTANETFTLASPEDALFTWKLGGVEDHCSACPDLAAGGPYHASDLPTHPRANGTPCLFNCDCSLLRDDGVSGFLPVEI